MNIERTGRSMLGIVAGVAFLAAAGIFTGAELDFGERVFEVSEYAVLAGFVALAVGGLLGGRSMDSFEAWEVGAVAIGVTVLAGVHFDVATITGLLEDYHPFTGIAATLIGYVGYHRLMWG